MAELDSCDWEVVEGFNEVAAQLLQRHLWKPVLWGRWEYDEDISVLEARALLKGIKRAVCHPDSWSKRLLFLVDNMGAVAARSIGYCNRFARPAPTCLHVTLRQALGGCPANSTAVTSLVEPTTLLPQSCLPIRSRSGHELLPDTDPVPRRRIFTRFEGHGTGPDTSAPGSRWGQGDEERAEGRLRLEHGVLQAPRVRPSAPRMHQASSSTSPTPSPKGTSRKEARSETEGETVNFDGLGELQRQPRSGSGNPPGATGRGTNHTTQLRCSWTGLSLINSWIAPLKSPFLDHALVQHMNPMYRQGYQSYRGDRLMVSVMHKYPACGRLGSAKLLRVWRALKGWRKLCTGGFPAGCMGGNCSAAEALAPPRHGCVRVDSPLFVCQAQRASGLQEGEFGQAGHAHHSP